MKVNSWIPNFSGFYDTIWEFSDSELDSELDYINECRVENNLKELEEFPDFDIDHKSRNKAIGKFYCEKITELLKDHGFKIFVKFESMSSPKYYNYANDSINSEYVLQKETYIQIIEYLEKNKEEFDKFLKLKYTSCSGFVSSYANSAEMWLTDLKNNADLIHRMGSIVDFILYMIYDNIFETEDYNYFTSKFELDMYVEMSEYNYNISEYILNDYDEYTTK